MLKILLYCVSLHLASVFAQNDPNCGTKGPTSATLLSRIVHGSEALPQEYPWQCALFENEEDHFPKCGCSILNSQWILTAAHCAISYNGVLIEWNRLEAGLLLFRYVLKDCPDVGVFALSSYTFRHYRSDRKRINQSDSQNNQTNSISNV